MEAYIIDTVRTPVGRRGGALSQVHPADLGAHTLRALMDRTGVDPAAVEDVVFGCLDAIGPQAGDIARTCWLAAGLPEEVPGTTVDRQCGSSQQAVHFAAQGVMSGTQDLVVAGGVQNMSMIPISSAMTVAEQFGFTDPFSTSTGWVDRYGTQEVSQFRGAELIADKWGISRDDMEQFAVQSHERALRAQAEGRFEHEIVPFGDARPRRRAPRAELGEDPVVEAARRGRPDHRRGLLADLRRLRRDADRVGAGGRRARPEAACAYPPPLGPRRRPDLHAERADPRDRLRAREVGDARSTTWT